MNLGTAMDTGLRYGSANRPGTMSRTGGPRRPSAVRLPRRRRPVGDLLAGALVAVALHGALWASGEFFQSRRPMAEPVTVAPLAEVGLCPFVPAAATVPTAASPAEDPGGAVAPGDGAVETTIVPLQLLGGRDCPWRAVCGRLAPVIAGGGAVGFTVDRSVLSRAGRGAAFVVFDLAELDQPPVVLAQPLPQYPPALLRTGAAGEVLVTFVVEADGRVRAVRAVSATYPEFEVPALQAVARWKFRPGRKGGRAVATRVEVPIAFSVPERRG